MNRQARPAPSVANEPETWMRSANTCPVRKCAYPYRRKLDGIRIHSDRNHRRSQSASCHQRELRDVQVIATGDRCRRSALFGPSTRHYQSPTIDRSAGEFAIGRDVDRSTEYQPFGLNYLPPGRESVSDSPANSMHFWRNSVCIARI
jgi:hypothetical protein